MSNVINLDNEKVRRQYKCGQCALVAINGVVCHETGCPNQGKAWRVSDCGQYFESDTRTHFPCITCGEIFEDTGRAECDDCFFEPDDEEEE